MNGEARRLSRRHPAGRDRPAAGLDLKRLVQRLDGRKLLEGRLAFRKGLLRIRGGFRRNGREGLRGCRLRGEDAPDAHPAEFLPRTARPWFLSFGASWKPPRSIAGPSVPVKPLMLHCTINVKRKIISVRYGALHQRFQPLTLGPQRSGVLRSR